MKIFFTCLFFFIIPILVFGQNFQGHISSSLYTFERFESQSSSDNFIRTFQSVNFRVTKNQFSLKSRLNLEADVANKLKNDPRLRVYNLFVEARNIGNLATIKVGRQPLITSVVGGVYDGINLKLNHQGFALTGFYGGNVPAYQKLNITDDWSNDYVLGGKLVVTSVEKFRFKALFIDKNFKRNSFISTRLDADLQPFDTLIERNSLQYTYLSGEASFSDNNLFDLDLKYNYDLNLEKTSRFQAFGRLNRFENFGITLFYNYREPRVRYNSIFSVFNYGSTQEIEAGVDYKITSEFTAIGKFANVSFKGDNSQRFTVGVNSNYGSLSYRKNLGYSGELDAVSIYSAKSFLEGLITPSIGLSFTSYKLSEDDETNSITTLLAGVNYRPVRKLSIDLQVQYLKSKIYKNDLRLFLKFNYWFNTNLDII